MSQLPITIATWDYDRVRALVDGPVQVEGCEVNYLTMPVEECFERAYFHAEFDVAEIGFSPYLIALSRGIAPYVAVPAFLSRMFRHSAIYIRNDRGIDAPPDLRGKRVSVPEYQMSAVMWARGFLQDEYGIAPADMNWVQGGLEQHGRRDKFPLNLLEGFPLSSAPEGRTLSQMLADGELDAVMSARRPSCFIAGHPNVRRLFPAGALIVFAFGAAVVAGASLYRTESRLSHFREDFEARDDDNWLVWVDVADANGAPQLSKTPVPTPLCPVDAVPAGGPSRLRGRSSVAGT